MDDDPERDKLIVDFRPRFTPPDAVRIMAVAAEMGLAPSTLIRLWVKQSLAKLDDRV